MKNIHTGILILLGLTFFNFQGHCQDTISGIDTGIIQYLAADTSLATDTSLYITSNTKPYLAPNTNPYLSADTSPYLVADTNRHLVSDTTTTTTTSAIPWFKGKVEGEIAKRPTEALDMISFSNFFWAIVFIVIGYYFLKLLISILNLFAERSARFRITIKSIIPIIRIVVWTLVIFIIIKGIFDPPMETVIAVSASIGIAVGLAASDLVKNVFGGITILFDRPFQVGDKIDVGNYYGEVLEIGLRITKLVTADDSIVSVPNAELMNNSISNSNSGELNCQVVAEIYLPIDVNTTKARKIALEAAQVSKFVYLKKPIVVLFFNEIKERRSYLKMRLKAYVMDIRYEFQFKSDMTEIVIRELLKQEVIKKDELF